MKFSENSKYITPLVEIVDVVCEAGFKNSTGDLTFNDGEDGGWYGLY